MNFTASNYRYKISDERLRAVADRVHQWLFADAPELSENQPPESDSDGR